MAKRIVSWADIAKRLGPSVLGTPTIEELTARQRWLLKTRGYSTNQPHGITAGFANYFAGDLNKGSLKLKPGQDSEYDEAVKQRDFIEWQWAQIDECLAGKNVPTSGSGADAEAFERAFATPGPAPQAIDDSGLLQKIEAEAANGFTPRQVVFKSLPKDITPEGQDNVYRRVMRKRREGRKS